MLLLFMRYAKLPSMSRPSRDAPAAFNLIVVGIGVVQMVTDCVPRIETAPATIIRHSDSWGVYLDLVRQP